MNVAIDYTKVLAEIAEKYGAVLTLEAGVYQIEYLAGQGEKIMDDIQDAFVGISYRMSGSHFGDCVIELEITEGN